MLQLYRQTNQIQKPINPITQHEYTDPHKEFWHNPAWSTSKRWSPPSGHKVLRCLPTEACQTDEEFDQCLQKHVAECDDESCCERTVLDSRYKLRPPSKKGIPKTSRYPFAADKSKQRNEKKERLVVDYRYLGKERHVCDLRGGFNTCSGPPQPTTWSGWIWKKLALWQPQKAHDL